MSQKKQRQDHNTIRLPESLTKDMDRLIGTKGFTSRAEIAKQAIREYLEKNSFLVQVPRFEYLDQNDAVIIIEHNPDGSTKTIAGLYFKQPNIIFCDYDHSIDCEHIRFALTVPKIRKTIEELNKKEGWNIKLP
jgi:metal-responsive CopG/Arc/MetJ family transcriptional regulator